MHTTN